MKKNKIKNLSMYQIWEDDYIVKEDIEELRQREIKLINKFFEKKK